MQSKAVESYGHFISYFRSSLMGNALAPSDAILNRWLRTKKTHSKPRLYKTDSNHLTLILPMQEGAELSTSLGSDLQHEHAVP